MRLIFILLVTRIMIFSDAHVQVPAPTSFQDQPKLVEHAAELLDTMVQRVIEQHPDILLIPGDLTEDGTSASHAYVCNALSMVRAAGTQVYVTPGNHDIKSGFNANAFMSAYGDYGYKGANKSNGLSYMTYLKDDLALIAVDSHTGNISDEQIQWITAAAQEAIAAGKRPIVMTHYPLVEHYCGHTEYAGSYIANQNSSYPSLDSVQNVLCQAGIRLVLTGHFHAHSASEVVTADGDTLHEWMTGCLSGYNSPYRTIEYNEGTLRCYTDTIDLYRALALSRNAIVAQTAMTKLSSKIPAQYAGIIPYLEPVMIHAYSSFARGDEPQNDGPAIKEEYDAAISTYAGSIASTPFLAGMYTTGIHFALDPMVLSILYNNMDGKPSSAAIPDGANTITLPPSLTTGMENYTEPQTANKVLYQGQVRIVTPEADYHIDGQRIQ